MRTSTENVTTPCDLNEPRVSEDVRNASYTGSSSRQPRLRHGHTVGHVKSRTWLTWHGMMGRCTKPTHHAYGRYGGAGVTVCERWHTFENFLEDMGLRPAGLSLDRINNAAGYYLTNCRWATAREQASNRRNNVFIEHEGERLTISQWARRAGLPVECFGLRLRKGMTMQRALTQPLRITKASRRDRKPQAG